MLEVRNLTKSYDGNVILDNVSLKIEKGDVITVIGPSGNGKTTLLRCLNFLVRPESGEMIFDDERYDLSRITKKEISKIRQKTGFVFQNYNLFENKTALGNVTEGLIVARKVPKKEAEEKAMKALAKVGMAEKKDQYPSQLSGGQQQRVAIARALALDPEIIYFDEPTSALDPELIGEVLEVMRDLARDGMTMLIVTHEMNFARNISTKVLFIEDKKIMEYNDTKEFFDNPKEERIREFLRLVTKE